MNAEEYKDLTPLAFYWVNIALDVDAEDPIDGWQNKEQPAMYKGNGKWVLLGVDEDEYWPVIWVGEDIKS